MVGVVILTHGRLAGAFLEASQQVAGPQSQVEAIPLLPEHDMQERRDTLMQAISRVNTGEGVIILTDMFGGEASNLAMSMLSIPRVEVIAGVNLPMLIKIFSKRKSTGLAEVASSAQNTGRKYINIASQLLEPQRKAS